MTDHYSCNFQIPETVSDMDLALGLFERMDVAVNGGTTLIMEDVGPVMETLYNCNFTNQDLTSVFDEITDEELTVMIEKVYDTQTIEAMNQLYHCNLQLEDYDIIVETMTHMDIPELIEDYTKHTQELSDLEQDIVKDVKDDLPDTNTITVENAETVEGEDEEDSITKVQQMFIMTKLRQDEVFDGLCQENLKEQDTSSDGDIGEPQSTSDDLSNDSNEEESNPRGQDTSSSAMMVIPSFCSLPMLLVISHLCAFLMF